MLSGGGGEGGGLVTILHPHRVLIALLFAWQPGILNVTVGRCNLTLVANITEQAAKIKVWIGGTKYETGSVQGSVHIDFAANFDMHNRKLPVRVHCRQGELTYLGLFQSLKRFYGCNSLSYTNEDAWEGGGGGMVDLRRAWTFSDSCWLTKFVHNVGGVT